MQSHTRIVSGMCLMLLLAACSAVAPQDISAPTETSVPFYTEEPSSTPSPTPTATEPVITLSTRSITPDATTMILPTFTPSPTPILPETSQSANGTCVPLSDSRPELVLDGNIDPLLDYLNAGGSPDAFNHLPLPTPYIDEWRVGHSPTLHQVVITDLTGDAIPDILWTETGISGYDYSELWAIVCTDGRYQSINGTMGLLGNINGRIESDGLYTGGGIRVLGVQDLNGDKTPELIISMGQIIPEYGQEPYYNWEYRLYEWDGSNFRSLLNYQTLFGEIDVIVSQNANSLAIIDQEGDGIQELLVDGRIFAWNGDVYTLAYEPPTPTGPTNPPPR